MRHALFCVLLFFANSLFGAQSFPQEDEKAIKELIEAHYNAWNQHDAKKMASLYAPDGDIRTSLNQMGKNQKEIEQIYRSQHQTEFKDAHNEIKIHSIQMIKPESAFVEVESTITGIQGADKAPHLHRVIFLLTKKNGNWQILSYRPF
jgi:uncharacterized protein (TIGR02246 family)